MKKFLTRLPIWKWMWKGKRDSRALTSTHSQPGYQNKEQRSSNINTDLYIANSCLLLYTHMNATITNVREGYSVFFIIIIKFLNCQSHPNISYFCMSQTSGVNKTVLMSPPLHRMTCSFITEQSPVHQMFIYPQQEEVPNKCTTYSCLQYICYKLRSPV